MPRGDRPGDQPGTTYLMVGNDSRADLTAEERKELGTGNASGQRTDTIMLLHTGVGPNLLMSIPRDSLVEVPGYGTTKINAAYAYGGPSCWSRRSRTNTGIRIDHYVEIGFGGFVDLVDAVGGIEVCPEFDMDDPLAKIRHQEGLPGGRRRSRARLRPVPQDRRAVRRPRPRRAAARGRLGDRQRGRLTLVDHQPGPLLTAQHGRCPTPYGSTREPVAVRAAQCALAMTRVNGDNGLTCGVPIADLAVHWDEERSEQMFQYIIDDDTSSIPKSLCSPSGFPR